ncbi:MAG: hypothetical protein HUU20_12450 [Pirellulales bacterium]|nr:hypothetical protein [Pirellulales bacterium]
MTHPMVRRVVGIGSIVACWAALAAAPAPAAEEAWRFLDGLRQRGYHDVVLDYLDLMAASPMCPEDLKAVLDYEAGMSLVNASRQAISLDIRQQQLDLARDRFQKFLKEHPDHLLASDAGTQLANVLVERGKIKIELAATPSKAAEKKQLIEEARKLYEEAKKAFVVSEQKVYERLKSYETTRLDEKDDAKKIEERDQARSEYVQAKLYIASATYEIGKTYDPGAKEYKENLQAAAKLFNELYEKYGTLIAGLYARMWEGRTYKDLGDYKTSLEILREMVALPDQPEAFRLLKNQSLILMLDTYTNTSAKNYKEALTRAQAWEEAARGDEKSSAEGLAIQYLGGMAALEYARQIGNNDPAFREHVTAARKFFEYVNRLPGDYQRKARETLSGSPEFGTVKMEEPKTYADAKDRGDYAWGTMVVVLGKLTQAGASKEELQKLLKQKNEARDEAIKYYEMSMGMKTPDVDLQALNLNRFRLAYLYWDTGDLYRAALMGEFLAREYPQSMGSQKGAEIAVKAYRTLFTQVKSGEDRTFETDRLNGIADYIIKIWPGQAEADEALMMLIDTAVDNRNMEKAVHYLEQVPADSPRRGPADLRTGQALWAAYVRAMNQPEENRPPKTELDTMLKQAQEKLRQGIERMRKPVDAGAPPDYTLVYSVLSLSQILINEGQAEEAAKWLDDPKIGPMTLVNAKNEITAKDNFKVDAYREGLRAYVGAQQLDKAEKVMASLEEAVKAGGDADANKQLTQIYIRLGRELQELLARLRSENKTEQMQKVSKGFELFLDKISSRKEGNNFNSLNWVAETYYGLGAGMDPGGKTLPPEAETYYKKAAATFLEILKRCKDDPKFAPQPGASTTVMVRMAAALRGMGKYEEAMKLLVSILNEKENRVDVQIEAALTYQEWGDQRPGYYDFAIKGGQQKANKNLVWGWGGIARRVAGLDQYRSTFHQARHNLALCRFNLALSQSGAAKTETLKLAELDVTRVQQLYPDMGGDEWYGKYDELLKKIQKALGKQADGLKTKPAVAKTG